MEFQNICNEMVAPFLLRHPVYKTLEKFPNDILVTLFALKLFQRLAAKYSVNFLKFNYIQSKLNESIFKS